MNASLVIGYIDVGLACLAGLWALILLFRNTSPAWKWIALAALLWGLTTCLRYFFPAVWSVKAFELPVFQVVQHLGLGLCLLIGMVSAR